MKILEVTIENAGKNLSAYIQDIPGIITVGNNINDINKNIKEALKLYLEDNDNPPELLLGEYELKFKVDTALFIVLYSDIFTKAALSRITGINQRQISHYAANLHKPQKRQILRIQSGIDSVVQELSMISIV